MKTIILGLTGSIGMGKSEAARMFRRLGIPVFDSDATVHRVMARGGAAVPAIEAAFPGVVQGGAVDRAALGARVFGKPDDLRRLESIVHPMVRAERAKFLRGARARRDPLVVFDIPLLYETGGERGCDAVLVVSAPAFVQRARVLARPGMTPEKFAAILGQQTADSEKRRQADFVVPTSMGKRATLNGIRHAVTMLLAQPKDCPCPS
ncbi:MAG: dephospho-CoA kinase [Alphaproteobacteria bacterium]|nr:dephospho-CoA kinase [Alphaproteobacteria bacterium]